MKDKGKCVDCPYENKEFCYECPPVPPLFKQREEKIVLLSASEAREKTDKEKNKGREVQFQNDIRLIKNIIDGAIAHKDYVCFINIDALSDVKRCKSTLKKLKYYVFVTDNDDLCIDWDK